MPITPSELGTFVGVCLVLAATPGANLAVVLRCASLGGQRAALAATVGLTVGKVVWATATLLGLAALLAASATAYHGLRLAGAAYLIWLGVQALRAAGQRTGHGGERAPECPALATPGAFRRGLLGDLLNPKVGLFYTTVFPQFIGPGDAVVPTAMLLVAAHAAVLLAWYPTASLLLTRASRVLQRPRLTAALDRATGTVLIALGLRLASASR